MGAWVSVLWTWVSVLWRTSSNLPQLSSTSTKAKMEVKRLCDGLFEFKFIRNTDKEEPTVELIFFHGLQFGEREHKDLHLTTWTKKSHPDEYWAQLFEEDETFSTNNIVVRALAASYDPSTVKTATKGRMDIYTLAESFAFTMIKSDAAKVGRKKGVPVILVGHAFGGLLIKEIIRQAARTAHGGGQDAVRIQEFLDNLAGVYYYSTPHIALKEEVFEKLFPKQRTHADFLKLLRELNEQVARLEMEMSNLQSRIGKNWGGMKVQSVFESHETDLGTFKGLLVPEASGRMGDSMAIAEDHFNICRPDNVHSLSYLRISKFIMDICAYPKKTGS